ncbi:MAG: hypothetical protein EAX95_11200 [Candidatus Thorarchaeota archaeon]|nr:hypothetical protein [Candidatus Thorarchaeota archaeon]
MDTKESLHQRSERKAIQIITDAVFGLAIGLAAFSLTEYEISAIEDVYFAIGFFFLTFFFVSLFWVWVRRFFEDYVVYGGAMAGILYILCFLVAILPFIMRLFFSGFFGEAGEVSVLAQTWLYPLDMGSISMLVGSLHVLFLNQGRGRVLWEEYKHIATDGYAAFVIGGGFLLSAAMPNNLTLAEILFFSIPSPLADIPAKIGVWFIVVLLAVIVYIPVGLGLSRMERSYSYTEQAS